MLVAAFMFIAFASARYVNAWQRGIYEEQVFSGEIRERHPHGPIYRLLKELQLFVFTSFGEVSVDDIEQEALYSLSVFFLTLFMLNLLVGVFSVELENVLRTREQTDYAAICEILLDLENTMFWTMCRRNSKHFDKQEHLIFAEEVKETETDSYEIEE
jgi:hypothetical protein